MGLSINLVLILLEWSKFDLNEFQPLNQTGWDFFTEKAQNFTKEFPESSFHDIDKPREEWGEESY